MSLFFQLILCSLVTACNNKAKQVAVGKLDLIRTRLRFQLGKLCIIITRLRLNLGELCIIITKTEATVW